MNKRIRNVSLLVIVFVASIIYITNVIALDDYTSGGSGNHLETGKGSYSSINGIRVAVIDSEGKLVSDTHVADLLNKTGAHCSGKTIYRTSTQMTKIQYKKNNKVIGGYDIKGMVNCEAQNGNYVYFVPDSVSDFGEFVYKGGIKKDDSSQSVSLQSWLTENDYSNLKEIVKLTGYNCFVNKESSQCSSTDYIVVEVLFNSKDKYGTGFELGNGGVFSSTNHHDQYYSLVQNVARHIYLSNGVLGLDSVSLNAYNTAGNYKNSADYLISDSKGAGIGVFKTSDMGVTTYNPGYNLTITKIGSITIDKKTYTIKLPGVEFKVYSGDTYKGTCTTDLTGKCTVKSLPNGTYTIKEVAAPAGYNTSGDVSVTIKGQDASATITNTRKTNTITINKKKLNGNPLNNATFRITVTPYTKIDCDILSYLSYVKEKGYYYRDYILTGESTLTVTLPSNVEYEVEEIKAPPDHIRSNDKKNGTLSLNVSFDFINKTQCEIDFDEAKDNNGVVSMEKRVELYNKYKAGNFMFNNLLDPDKTLAQDACSHNSSCGDLKSSISCLSGNTSIEGTNLACYNDIIKASDGTDAGYCITNFKLVNKLNKDSWTSLSGQLLIDNMTNPVLATGTLTSYCYVFKKSNAYTSNFVSSVDFKYKNKNVISNSDTDYTYNGDKVTQTGNYDFLSVLDYNFKPVYSQIGTGKIVNEKCENCIFLGYGVGSNLNDRTVKGELPFQITYQFYDHKSIPELKEIIKGTDGTKNKCTYSTEKKIVACDPSDPDCDDDTSTGKEMLNLEFRIIDTTNPFPGKSGNGRKVGSNWCDPEHNYCFVENNPIIKATITDSNDSYNSKKTGAKYKITLNRDNIERIRNYNKNHSYDDFETMKCDSDGNCTSTFLKEMGITK